MLSSLRSSNPILDKVGNSQQSIAKFVLSQLKWTLVCDDIFWYKGELSLAHGSTHNLSDGVKAEVQQVCGLLNAALDSYFRQQTEYNELSSFLFASNGPDILIEIRGVRDVPSKFPTGQLMKHIDKTSLSYGEPALPRELALSLYTARLKCAAQASTSGISANTHDSAKVVIPETKVHLSTQCSFVRQVNEREKERQTQAAVAA